ANQFNTTTFAEITTRKLRLEFDSDGPSSTGILEWRVYDSGKSPNFAPTVSVGPDRFVVLPGRTYLNATARDDGKPRSSLDIKWSQESGPGEVAFADATAASTTATFSKPGEYALRLTANDGQASGSGILHVTAMPPAPATPLNFVWPRNYKVNSPFWQA